MANERIAPMILRVSTIVSLLLMALGCAGDWIPEPDRDVRIALEEAAKVGIEPEGAPPSATGSAPLENRRQCEAFVQAFNELSCLPAEARLDASGMCPAELDLAGCDQRKYWTCMREKVHCDGTLPIAGDTPACSPVCG